MKTITICAVLSTGFAVLLLMGCRDETRTSLKPAVTFDADRKDFFLSVTNTGKAEAAVDFHRVIMQGLDLRLYAGGSFVCRCAPTNPIPPLVIQDYFPTTLGPSGHSEALLFNFPQLSMALTNTAVDRLYWYVVFYDYGSKDWIQGSGQVRVR